jgi:membrane protein insertase Oxa1/YidC/SpoIIIJ
LEDLEDLEEKIDVPEIPDLSPEVIDISRTVSSNTWDVSNSIFSFMENVPLVEWIESALSAVHNLGVPWWSAIIMCAVSMKIAIWPLTRIAIKNARVELNPEVRAFYHIIQNKKEIPDEEKKKIQESVEKLKYELGFRRWKGFLPNLQLPLSICCAFAIGFLTIKDPSMHYEGLLWFQNLASADPWLRLAYINGFSSLIIHEVNVYYAQKYMGRTQKDLGWLLSRWGLTALCFLTIPFIGFLPQGMVLFWTTGSMLRAGQTMAALIRYSNKLSKIETDPEKVKELNTKKKRLVKLVKEDGRYRVKYLDVTEEALKKKMEEKKSAMQAAQMKVEQQQGAKVAVGK